MASLNSDNGLGVKPTMNIGPSPELAAACHLILGADTPCGPVAKDRAVILAIAILAIIQDSDALDGAELQHRLTEYLRDEIADVEQQITNDQGLRDA